MKNTTWTRRLLRAAVSPKGRTYLYRVALATLTAAVGIGILPPGALVYLIPLATALLNVSDEGNANE